MKIKKEYHILDALGEAVFILNREYIVLYWNSVIEEWTGISKEEVIGKKITDFYEKFKEDLYTDRVNQIFDGGPPAIFSSNLHKDLISCKTRQGIPRIQHTMVKPIEGNGKNEVFALFSLTDVTALTTRLKEIRSVNKQYLVELEKREVVEEELLRAREEALEISRHKSDFLASMSHEIRTPLNAILGMGEVLSEFDVSVEYDKYLEIQRSASKNLLNLINDILDLSKIDAGQMTLEEIPLDLASCGESSLDLLKFSANQKNTKLTLIYDKDTPRHFLADPNRLTQVFLNLLNNAIKFTSNGEVKLIVSKDYKKESRNILIEVKDTGKGISKSKLSTIFNAFSQESKSTTREYGGTGLGLTITRKFIDLMNGEIWVESEENVGTSFFVTIPMKEDIVTKEKALHASKKKRTLLLVDDNEEVINSISDLLEKMDLNIIKTNNGNKALEYILEKEIDAVVTDFGLPGIDGLELIQKAKAVKNYLPFILISWQSEKRDLMRSLHLGLSNFFEKPIQDYDLFIEVVTSALEIGHKKRLNQSFDQNIIVTSQNILIAEDSMDNQDLLKAYLKKTSHKLTFVENGKEAIDKFIASEKKGEPYDLVLMDIQMPICNGYEATIRIREWERENNKKETPIVALSAYSMTKEVQKSINAGCNSHISKPVSKKDLIKAIAEMALAVEEDIAS